MIPKRKLLAASAFTFALAGGGVAGVMLGTPGLSSAQDGTDQTAAATPSNAGPGGHVRGEGLATAAEALGMTEAELRTALEGGSSIAQVAEAEGVDLQTVIDALVAAGTERLQELEASLPDRVTELVNRTDWADHRGHHDGGPGGPGGRGPGLDAAADAIGITTDELRTALQDGSTLAEVAAAHDVTTQALIDALVADATTHLDEAVANGRIDAARAEEMKANLVERITARVNGEHPEPPADAPAGDSVG
jgi:transposase-like protein